MQINVHFSSNPDLVKKINFLSDDYASTVENIKSSLFADIPNKFKSLYHKKTELNDKKSLFSYGCGRKSILDLFIEDKITIKFKSMIFDKPMKMDIETKTPYTYKSLIEKFLRKKKIENPMKIQEIKEEEKLLWDDDIINGSVLNLIEENEYFEINL